MNHILKNERNKQNAKKYHHERMDSINSLTRSEKRKNEYMSQSNKKPKINHTLFIFRRSFIYKLFITFRVNDIIHFS